MRKSFIGGNWKMNGTRAEVRALIDELIQLFQANSAREVVLFPPYVYLQEVKQLLANFPIALGGQNVSEKEKGAFTGEISASMLLEFGCRYVLVGHSERRQFFFENDEVVAAKFLQASHAGLWPVLCVGETLEERKKGMTESIVQKQIEAVINLAGLAHFKNAIIAYEPVWAIGTGVTATKEQAQTVHQFIRELLGKLDKNLANELRIIYGGSVKAANAKELFAMPDIDGGLIGGASLNAEEFMEIINYCKK